jgi:hypothetical protein
VFLSSEESITCKKIEENQETHLLLFHKKSRNQKLANQLTVILEENNVKKVTHLQNIKIQFLSQHIPATGVKGHYTPAKNIMMNSSPTTASPVTNPYVLNAPSMDYIKIMRFKQQEKL